MQATNHIITSNVVHTQPHIKLSYFLFVVFNTRFSSSQIVIQSPCFAFFLTPLWIKVYSSSSSSGVCPFKHFISDCQLVMAQKRFPLLAKLLQISHDHWTLSVQSNVLWNVRRSFEYCYLWILLINYFHIICFYLDSLNNVVMISDLVMLWQDKRVNTEQYLPSTNWSDQQIRVYWRTLAWTSQIFSRKLNDRMTTENYQETMILTKTRKHLHMFHHPDIRSWERMRVSVLQSTNH